MKNTLLACTFALGLAACQNPKTENPPLAVSAYNGYWIKIYDNSSHPNSNLLLADAQGKFWGLRSDFTFLYEISAPADTMNEDGFYELGHLRQSIKIIDSSLVLKTNNSREEAIYRRLPLSTAAIQTLQANQSEKDTALMLLQNKSWQISPAHSPTEKYYWTYLGLYNPSADSTPLYGLYKTIEEQAMQSNAMEFRPIYAYPSAAALSNGWYLIEISSRQLGGTALIYPTQEDNFKAFLIDKQYPYLHPCKITAYQDSLTSLLLAQKRLQADTSDEQTTQTALRDLYNQKRNLIETSKLLYCGESLTTWPLTQQ